MRGSTSARSFDRDLSKRTATIVFVTCTLTLAGCTATCAPAAWELSFESAAVEATARAVRIRVRRGTCASRGEVVYSRSLVRGGMSMRPPTLGAGPFALEASALDASCREIASACTDLPAAACPAAVQQELVGSSSGSPVCSSCVDGVCPSIGADAGPDSRTCDASETRCDDRVDDDCDGDTDCADSECDLLSVTCPGGGPGICRAGACCSGCWDGSSCASGHSRQACGNGGTECADCGGCTCGGAAVCGC